MEARALRLNACPQSPHFCPPLQASQEALLVAAKLLKWKQLKHLTQTQQTCRIGECLVRTTPKPQGPGWTRGAPCAAEPCLPCSSPEPTAWSCILLPCRQAQSPQGLFSRPLSPPHPQDAEGDPSPSGPWQWDGGVLGPPDSPLLVTVSEPQPHRAPGWEMGMAWAGKGYAGCCEEGLVRPPAEGL